MKEGGGYAVIDDVLAPGIVVDVDCDSAEGGDFGGEFGEAGVVLLFAFVGVGHCVWGVYGRVGEVVEGGGVGLCGMGVVGASVVIRWVVRNPRSLCKITGIISCVELTKHRCLQHDNIIPLQ